MWASPDAFDADNLRLVTPACTAAMACLGAFGGLRATAPSFVLALHMVMAGVCVLQHVLLLVEVGELSNRSTGRADEAQQGNNISGSRRASFSEGDAMPPSVVMLVCASSAVIATAPLSLYDSFALFHSRYYTTFVRDDGRSGVYVNWSLRGSRGSETLLPASNANYSAPYQSCGDD